MQGIKERARCTITVTPYQTLPRLMVIELMHFCQEFLKNGAQERLLPGTSLMQSVTVKFRLGRIVMYMRMMK